MGGLMVVFNLLSRRAVNLPAIQFFFDVKIGEDWFLRGSCDAFPQMSLFRGVTA